jgi:hypothetical protein
MGWFFKKKKKVLDVPVPMRKFDDGALQFDQSPKKASPITSKDLKSAAGINTIPSPMPQKNTESQKDPFTNFPDLNKAPSKPTMQQMPAYNQADEFVYLKIEQYKRTLGELESTKDAITKLTEISRKLHVSEYNEERNFARLKNTVRSIHDRFLTIDNTLFKS